MWFSGFAFKNHVEAARFLPLHRPHHPPQPPGWSSSAAKAGGLAAQPVPPTWWPMHVHVLPEGNALSSFQTSLLDLEGARDVSVARD